MVQCKEYCSKRYYANFFGTYLKMVLLRNSTMQGGVMQGLPVVRLEVNTEIPSIEHVRVYIHFTTNCKFVFVHLKYLNDDSLL